MLWLYKRWLGYCAYIFSGIININEYTDYCIWYIVKTQTRFYWGTTDFYRGTWPSKKGLTTPCLFMQTTEMYSLSIESRTNQWSEMEHTNYEIQVYLLLLFIFIIQTKLRGGSQLQRSHPACEHFTLRFLLTPGRRIWQGHDSLSTRLLLIKTERHIHTFF